MRDLELKIIVQKLGVLEINYEEVKKEITTELEKYQGLVVTKNDIADAKDTRANLNKVTKMIKNRRLELKKGFLKPYEIIESQTRELINMIEEVVSSIDSQIKNLENKDRQQKLVEVEKRWRELNYHKVPFEKVLQPEYLNKTYSLDKVVEKFKQFISKTEQDLKALDDLLEDKEQALELKKKYLARLDFAQVLESLYEEKQAQKALQEQKLYQLAANENILKLEVIGTKKQLKLLFDFLNDHKIKYQKI